MMIAVNTNVAMIHARLAILILLDDGIGTVPIAQEHYTA
jgi:hypothetical protein